MKVLLDTQAWLWMQVSPERFSTDARAIVEDTYADLFFSAASAWEIAIKYALGRLPLPEPPTEYVPDRMRTSGVIALPVEHLHALYVSSLPDHHRDPFDRLLIAQASVEELTIMTSDRTFESYDVAVSWTA